MTYHKVADPHIFCLTPRGLKTARRLARATGGHIHAPRSLATHKNTHAFETFSKALQESFLQAIPVIGVCSSGILIRILAPLLISKTTDPPVVCVAEDGNSVIPLIGGHAGANTLSRTLAVHLDAHAAITTASDLAFGIALDQPPAGWKLVRPAPIKSLTMALLSGEPVTLSLADPWLEPLLEQKNVRLAPRTLHKDPLVVSSGGTHLIYRRQDLVVGIGCSRNCPAEDLIGLVGSTLADAGIATESITGLYTALVKADEDAVAALARALDLPVRYYSIDTLNTVRHRLKNPSPDVQAAIGTPGVAEAAALLAAGPDGELIVEKRKSGNATCAIARQGAAPGNPGRLRGLLNIIGIGPGHAAGRTVEATNAILTADHVVGYGGYLDLVKPLLGHQEVRAFPLGEEIDRCRYAIETAAAGTSVALICSGDSGIYAMAAPVFEILDQDGDSLPAAAHRIAIHCLPGVSAMQTASARAGAVLGHDFAVVSLSDLMTPAEKILERLQAAAEGDFVIALYNPASHERKKLIYQALEIVRQYRSPTTPVLIARNVGRIGESSTVATLATVPVSSADMVTTLIIGNSQSRSFEMGPGTRVVYTPRGYTDPGRGARAAGGNPS